MTAKEYLRDVYEVNKKINAKLDYIERLETIATKMTPSLQVDKVQTSKTETNEDTIIKLIGAREELRKLVDDHFEIQKKAIEMINKLEDGVLQEILIYRYLFAMSFTEIANKLNYSHSHIKNLHNKAIKDLEKY